MEGADRLVPASAYTGNPDLFISVDVPVVERLNNSAEVLRRSKHVVCFDHHPAREEFAELSLRRVEAAACAMIIDRFLDNCGIVARDGVANELRDPAYARERLAAMLGPQMQVPPAFSAISVNGVRAYKSAREGNAVDLPPRPVEVYAADLIAVGGEGDACVWTVAFSVSKGTYIRALARDLGRACESAAHISALRRTASGVVSIGACHAVEELSPESAAGFALDPIAALGATRVDLPGNLADDLLCGRRIPVERAFADFDASKAPFALVLDGGLKALARIESGRFVMEHVFPQAIGGVR